MLGRTPMKTLDKIFRCCEGSTPKKIKTVQAIVVPVRLDGSEEFGLEEVRQKKTLTLLNFGV